MYLTIIKLIIDILLLVVLCVWIIKITCPEEGEKMKVFLVKRTDEVNWCQDYAMVIVAEDELHAERKARLSSNDFKTCQKINVTEIDINKEQCVLVANTGA